MVVDEARIAILLKAWSNKTATEVEEKELMDMVVYNDPSASVQGHIEQLVKEYQPGEQLPVVDWERMYEDIKAARKTEEPALIKRMVSYKKMLQYAAVAVIMLGIATYIWLRNEPSSSTISQAKDSSLIVPGKEGAILTLADGRQVVLDSLKNGVVTNQNGTQVILNSGQLLYDAKQAAEVGYNTITTPRGRQYQLVLPDGSKVWLNAESSVKFPTAFIGKERRVEVKGEVYMEVAKNLHAPFSVSTGNTTIQVLGTSFNINTYPEEETQRTTLISGSVRVLYNNQAALLQPGQQASIPITPITKIKQITVQTTNIEQTLAWKNGYFNFDGADLPTVMRQLERWYDIQVKYEGKITEERFRGEMQRNLNLAQILRTLEYMNIKFRLEGRTLIVE